ncbi:GntR family transcriptional regulator [Neobacillus niacini]|uniref:GntR family transcriptional regulator n=1 Tax=Neobacillus niacini TaxID=86668 RepID=UPI0021CB36A2|nr:GntR family transcriptional regulator [Neobacillus niacini]MCM3767723.1 GntR family transcriptional regulator [Neobacillus niacini]
MLDEKNVIPLYYQLKEILKEKIKDGSWQEGLKVPSERELMEFYSVSRATVRKALSEMMMEGLIYSKQGVGTFVSKTKITQNLIGELSFNLQAILQGLTPSSKVVYAALESPLPNRIMDIFNLNQNEKIHKIIRVRSINDTPLILETLYIPYKFAPEILNQDLKNIAVFNYLESECKLTFTHSTLEIEPIAINEFESNFLEIEVGKPSLSLERVIYFHEQVIAIQRRIMRGDRGKFSLTLGEKPKKHEDYLVGIEFNE